MDCIITAHKAIVATSPDKSCTIVTISSDDMTFLAKQFLDCQSEFRNKGKCTHVSIGYRHMHSTAFRAGVSVSSNPCVYTEKRGLYFLVAIVSFHM